MSKNTKKESYKPFIKLINERAKIWKLIDDLGYIELEEPIHHGYDSFFVLRDDISRRKDAPLLEDLLKNYTSVAWCRNKDFIVKRRGKKEKIEPSLVHVSVAAYLLFSPKKQEFFTKHFIRGWHSVREVYCLNLPRHYYVIKKKKSYITHRKVMDAQLQSDLDLVYDQINEITEVSNPYNNPCGWDVRFWNKASRRKDNVITSNIKNHFDGELDSDLLEYGLSEKARHGANWYR